MITDTITATTLGSSVTHNSNTYQALKNFPVFENNSISKAFIASDGAALYVLGARFPLIKTLTLTDISTS